MAAPASAQQPSGSIAGTIVDPLGARVAGAIGQAPARRSDREGNHERPSGRLCVRRAARRPLSDSGDAPKDFRSEPRARCSSPPARSTTVDVSLPLGPLGDGRDGHGGGERRPALAGRRAGHGARREDARRASASPTCSRRCGWCPAARWSRPERRGGTTSDLHPRWQLEFQQGADRRHSGQRHRRRRSISRRSRWPASIGSKSFANRTASSRAPTHWPASSASRRAGAKRAFPRRRFRSTVATSARTTSRPRLAASSSASTTSASSRISAPTTICRTTSIATRRTPVDSASAVGHNTDVSATVRWIDKYYGSPNGVSLYGTPDDAFQTNRHAADRGRQPDADHRQMAGVRARRASAISVRTS